MRSPKKMNKNFPKTFRRQLLRWYDKNQRDLPWRHNRDPYSIWVSEVMLQQTQVATVIPYYERFLKKFPTLLSLAQAEEEEVLAIWSGLGYYRRAKLLHRGTQEVQLKHQGKIPTDPNLLKTIPGIGPYTAGAIASIAFQQPTPLVDGNVIRVLSRIFAKKGHAKEGKLHKEIWKLAQDLVDLKKPGDFNQALMELGATTCRVVLPSCTSCPLNSLCKGYQLGKPEQFPETPPAKKTIHLKRVVATAWKGDKLLLVKRKEARWFQGMWELPHEYLSEGRSQLEVLQTFLQQHFGTRLNQPQELPTTTHSITHHRIKTLAWQGLITGLFRSNPIFLETQFFDKKKLLELPLPNFDRKVLVAAKII
jgi:A/G-specific adenine glycosylase